MPQEQEEQSAVRHWEHRVLVGLAALLTTVFGLWAGVVWNGTKEVVARIDSIVAEQRAEQIEFQKYITMMERRVTIIEERQNDVRRRLQIVEGDGEQGGGP